MTEHFYCFDTHTRLLDKPDTDFLSDLGEIRLTPIPEPDNEALQDYTMQDVTVVEVSGLFFKLDSCL